MSNVGYKYTVLDLTFYYNIVHYSYKNEENLANNKQMHFKDVFFLKTSIYWFKYFLSYHKASYS